MKTRVLIGAAVLTLAGLTLAATAQMGGRMNRGGGQHGRGMMGSMAMMGVQDSTSMMGPQAMRRFMVQRQKAMQGRIDSLDQILDQKLEKVRSARSDRDKIAALQAVVEEMVAQRRAMGPGMMMSAMMQWMNSDMTGMTRMMDVMGNCPMMQATPGDGGKMQGTPGRQGGK